MAYKDLIFSLLPLVLLIYLMTKKKSIPSYKALPLCAVLFYFIKLIYFQNEANLINATVVQGFLAAWTPILIVWGAILLFKTMEHCGSLDVIRGWLNNITTNRVAQIMIVGWAFGFFIEGVSGFGTPAALAAPILVGLGFAPINAAILALIMNSVPVTFGAVGTPTWFGLGQLGLSSSEVLEIGFKSATIHCVAAMVIPLIALRFVVSWDEIKKSIGYIYLSILSCTVPYLIFASFDYEFPSIVGGFVGLIVSVVLASKGVGLGKKSGQSGTGMAVAVPQLVKASFPLWMTVLVLLVTRISQLGIKQLLTATEPVHEISLGSLATFTFTNALVVDVTNIFGTSVHWTHKLLYVPSIIPFFVVSLISFFVFKMNISAVRTVWTETFSRVKRPIIALIGALIFVRLFMVDPEGGTSCTVIIGTALAQVTVQYWQYFASYLGALGAFFSGSNTVSNLTFAPIQDSIAQSLELNRTIILSEQSVGGAMGNMVCINNIVAVCSVLGIENKEGFILKRTVWPMLVYGIIAALVSLFL
ncbi:MAG: L-lactate permease [Anaerohalosphaera sp.]|nr:L-lactate permease [Anaerohalosphaera sp.]